MANVKGKNLQAGMLWKDAVSLGKEQKLQGGGKKVYMK